MSDDIEFFQSPSITKLMPALLDAVGEFEPLVKDSTNPHFRSTFSSHKAVLRATMPALLKNRLMPSAQCGYDRESGANFVLTRIIHESGEWIGGRLSLKPVKDNDPQAEGSALTYAKRQTLKALLGIAEEDDDGNAASAQRQPERREPERQRRLDQGQVDAAVKNGAPSGRNWWDEANNIYRDARKPAGERKGSLLQLMEECRVAGELEAALRADFMKLGEQVNAEIASAVK